MHFLLIYLFGDLNSYMEYSEHNNYALPEVGDGTWGPTIGANYVKAERGLTIKGTAGTTLSINDVVYQNSNFKFEKAINDLAGGTASKFVGFAMQNMNLDTEGYVLHSGFTVGATWNFTAGPVYLSQTLAGDVTQAGITSDIVVGYAIGTNELIVKPWVDMDFGGTGDFGEGHINFLSRTWSTEVGTWNDSMTASQPFYHYQHNEVAEANGDYVKYKAFLAAGVYTTRLVAVKNTNFPYVQILVDSDPVGATIDLYGSLEWFTVHTLPGFTVETDGLKDVYIKVQGRNPSSSGWRTYFTHLAMWRTA